MQIPAKPWEPDARTEQEKAAEVQVIPQNGSYIVRIQGQIKYCQKPEEALAYLGNYFGLIQPNDSILIYLSPRAAREMNGMLWAEVVSLKTRKP